MLVTILRESQSNAGKVGIGIGYLTGLPPFHEKGIRAEKNCSWTNIWTRQWKKNRNTHGSYKTLTPEAPGWTLNKVFPLPSRWEITARFNKVLLPSHYLSFSFCCFCLSHTLVFCFSQSILCLFHRTNSAHTHISILFPHLVESSMVYSLNFDGLWVSELATIYCKKKLPWWGLRESLVWWNKDKNLGGILLPSPFSRKLLFCSPLEPMI